MLEERARAAGLTLSEWVRDVLLAAPAEPGAELAGEVVLAELLALRSLFLNLQFRSDKGQLSEAELRSLIERADATKKDPVGASPPQYFELFNPPSTGGTACYGRTPSRFVGAFCADSGVTTGAAIPTSSTTSLGALPVIQQFPDPSSASPFGK